MRILITAGGTIVKIDNVRHIGNFSSGSFPAKIADASLIKGHDVIYLHAKKSKIPTLKRSLKLFEFETYDDYAKQLKKILRENNIDIILLGAAVSDFGVKQYKGKFPSIKESINIRLFRLPKVIKEIKRWSKKPLFQIGFKLLSGVDEKELVEVAYKSSLENHSDLTIANDLYKIKSGKREVILVTPEKGAIKLRGPDLAKKIVQFVEKRAQARHFKTVLATNKDIIERYNGEFKIFKQLCALLNKQGLMPDFFKGAKSGHGSLALRVGGNSFLITSRGSNKKNLQFDDVVLVKKVDWKKKEIIIESISNKKASFNAVLVAKILEKLPRVNAVVHTHSFKKNAPTTEFACTPGTFEYATKPMNLFKKNTKVINLNNHGLVAVGSDLRETVNYVLR